jgi:hypothetical protein
VEELRVAAVELRTAGLAVGVEPGEAFIGSDRRFATGDVFVTAAQLQSGAPEGEILLGDNVHRLIRDAVRAERRDHAWRLVGLEAQEPASTRFVGRARELAALDEAFAALDGQATVAIGRCPSYGEGLAYRPVAEILAGLGAEDPLAGDTPAQPEELCWAVRRVLARAAEERPLVVLVEDIHWAEAALLDLLDYLMAFVVAHPLLLVCLTRPELADTRPAWVAPGHGRAVIALDALPDEDARRLVTRAGAVDAETAARIVATAEGNPLFLEQLVAVGEESGEPVLPHDDPGRARSPYRPARADGAGGPGGGVRPGPRLPRGRARGRPARGRPARRAGVAAADPPRAVGPDRRGRVPLRACADP